MELLAIVRRRILNSSDGDSESSSDDDWDVGLVGAGSLRREKRLRPRIELYAETVVESYTDYEFKTHFRLSRATFEYTLACIGADLQRSIITGNPSIPPSKQFMVALWKMATMDSYRSICDRFNVGRATAVRCVRRVTRALFIRAPIFIQWPSDEKAVLIMRGFEGASGFPKAIGAIDGTHIRIDAPKENHTDYINRKGFHSIQLQLVCDHKTLITHCYTGHPGSVHDQRVFRQSEVSSYLDDNQRFHSDSHLLGDAAYELHQHLLTPYRDNGHLTERQKNYNFRHSSARMAVERCIGLLKGRMRSLLHCLPMKRVDLMAEYIVACCVIHNICTLRGDELEVVTLPQTEVNVPLSVGPSQQQSVGILKRNLIMEVLYNNNLHL